MNIIIKWLPYWFVEKLYTDYTPDKGYLKNEEGFKQQTENGLEVDFWEISPGIFLCKSTKALLKNKRERLQREIIKIESHLGRLENEHT
jgi:hypothetical protein